MHNNLTRTLFMVLLAFVAQQAFAEQASGGDVPRKPNELAPHPRLYISQAQLDRAVKGRGEEFAETYKQIEAAAETGLRDLDEPMKGMSEHSRSFKIQGRLMSLAIQWHRTKDRRYLEAALKTVAAMEDWLDFGNDFILWHGQCIAGIAVTYDLLYNDLTPEEKEWFIKFAREHCIKPFLSVTGRRDEGQRGSWWQYIVSNWNPVCNSGPGMLALAMYEDIDEAPTVVERVDKSYKPIIDYLQQTDGGWVEGLGYWNWTIHYMSLFYMSYERSTGLRHEGFRSKGFKDTLTFGQYFVPNAEECGFGDNQHGGVSVSLFAAAEFLGYDDDLRVLQDYRKRYDKMMAYKNEKRGRGKASDKAKSNTDTDEDVNVMYSVPHKLLIDPVPLPGASLQVVTNMVHTFPKQGWSMVADQWPKPNIYASIRGGKLGGPHTHSDLLSWNGVVGIEKMICTVNKAGYYDTSWQQRAWEIYERNAASENTIFIGGLSAYTGNRPGYSPEAKTKDFELSAGPAVRLDATKAFWLTRRSPTLVARVFVVLGDKGLLVVDRIIGRGSNPVEVRTHTEKKATFGKTDVLLEGEFETARMTFACDQPAILHRAIAMLTDARAKPPTVIRWQTLRSVRNVTLASLLSRGPDPVELSIEGGKNRIVVIVKGKDWQDKIELDGSLQPLDSQ